MKVLLDNQIYKIQKFGGISKYFSKLTQYSNSITQLNFYDPNLKLSLSFYEKVKEKLLPGKKGDQMFTLKEKKRDFYKSQFKELEYDIFHPTYYDNYFLEHLMGPFVVTVYDMIHEKYPEYFGINEVSEQKRNLCEAASKIIAISQTTKNDIIEIFQIDPGKIEVIYLATDYDSLEPVKPKIGLFENQYILFTGNRSIYKNFLTFLIAVAPILKVDHNLHVLCTGPVFSKAELKWINDLGLQGRVHCYFCNSDNELVYLYKNALCFVFPSLYEGFGLPILDAFACNCPIVSSNGGSLAEIAADGAIYFDPKNISEIRSQVELMLYNKDLRDKMIEAGRNRLKNFSWEKCSKETMSLYLNVIEYTKKRPA